MNKPIETPIRIYTNWGPICGGCSHNHATIALASQCNREARIGNFSDRSIHWIDEQGYLHSVIDGHIPIIDNQPIKVSSLY